MFLGVEPGFPMWRYLSVGWVVAAQRPVGNPAEVTKHTFEVIYKVMDGFENSDRGNKVQWACAGGGGRMARAQFSWCLHVAIFVRWVGFCSSEASQAPAEVTKHTYKVMDGFENSDRGNKVQWACAGGG